MDPSTQRMLERARARRQKLDAQLSNAGHDVAKKRNPLQEKQTQLLKVTTEVEVTLSKQEVSEVNVSPTKVQFNGKEFKENTRSTAQNVDSSDIKTNPSDTKTHTDNGPMRDGIRTQLKRLGALYSDSQLSSPIHRTEYKFSSESAEEVKVEKPTARSTRLAALADSIKQWEDDVSHPQEVKSGSSSPEKLSKSVATSASSKPTKHETPLPPFPKQLQTTNQTVKRAELSVKDKTTKKVIWDKAILETLDSEDRPSSINKDTAVSSKVPKKLTSVKEQQEPSSPKLCSLQSKMSTDSPKGTCNPVMGIASLCNSSSKLPSSPDKSVSWKSGGSPRRGDIPQMGMGSPRKIAADGSPQAGSVLHKASLFEASSPTKKPFKDPAELSVSERLALFERNKGQALVPKAPFSMAVPVRYLGNEENGNIKKDVPSEKAQTSGRAFVPGTKGGYGGAAQKSPTKQEQNSQGVLSGNKVLAHRHLFESGVLANHDNTIVRNSQSERQKDMEMLLNRWSKNKQVAGGDTGGEPKCADAVQKPNQTEEANMPPPPPPPPQESCQSPSKMPQVMSMSPKRQPTILHASPKKQVSIQQEMPTVEKQASEISSSKGPLPYQIKKIKVSPPKPGFLYPCLSDIDAATTETESEIPEEYYEQDEYSISSAEMDSSSNMDSSFGREILQAAGVHKSPLTSQHNNQATSSDESDTEAAVLEDIDDFLDEALGNSSSSDSEPEGPTPPKKTRDTSRSPKKIYSSPHKNGSPTSTQSQSFRYTHGAGASPQRTPTHVVDGDQELPLIHTVSFYRRQQNMSLKNTPVRQVVRQPEVSTQMSETSTLQDDELTVRRKITDLLDEVSKQQTVISQASQALNLCCATVEFSGSAEEVEGERLLLLATHKRQAALHEIQRLKVEGSLKPLSEGSQTTELMDKGSLTISNIVLPLKKEYVHCVAAGDMCHHFVCLVRSQEQVLITPVQAAILVNLQQGQNLVWNNALKLHNIYGDFKATLEVYAIQTLKEILPHNIKYHIGNKKDGGKLRLTPKKLLKQESRLVMPTVQSPAGPTAVRSPSFHLAGYVVFSLREVSRTNFTLNKVAYTSPLEGIIQLRMSSELSFDVSEHGFLTMFEDVSGFGAWHRRWCVLKGSVLAYWKYPDDERKKVPIGQIDLNMCTTKVVGLVSRDICARPNTFLLETTRAARADDEDSLVLVRCKDQTIIRHLLSADTKEERLVWCTQINKTLCMLRAWGNKTR